MRDAIRFLGEFLVRWAGPREPIASRRLTPAERDAAREQKRISREADMARLRQLGGVPRTAEEQTEFLELLVRHGCSEAYFEHRGWEHRVA